MEVNHFNIACCEPSLGNHFFSGFAFANAADVEGYFGISSGGVTFFATNKFTTLVPYDVESDGSGSIVSNSEYKDFWGIIRDFVQTGTSAPRTDIKLYSYNVRNIEQSAFSQIDDSEFTFKNIENLGLNNNPIFNGCNNCIVNIENFNKFSDSAFSDMTDCVIRLGSKIGEKISTDIYGTSTSNLFNGSTDTTIYCSADFASSQIMVDSLAINPSITLITY
jgi:hypothetical protein